MKDKTSILIRVLIGLLVAAIAAVLILPHFHVEKKVEALDFTLYTEEEISKWAAGNKIKVNYEYEYSEEAESGTVLSQTPQSGTQLKEGDEITIVLSQGADPDLEVELIDFKGYDYEKIQAWVTENKMQDVTYEYAENEEVEKGLFVSHNIDTETVKRGDMMIFTLSLGAPQEEEEPKEDIIVPDFSTYTKNQVSNWGSANSVTIKFATATSTTIEKNEFIKQSITAGQKVREGSTITVTYSIGKPVEAIDLSGKTKTEVIKWLESYDNRINITYVEKYSDTVEKNKVISNSPKSGTMNDKSTMTVTISLGKPTLDDFVGKSYSDLEAQVKALNAKGANIQLSATQQESETYSEGKIISQDKSGEVSVDTTVTVVYSSGKVVTVKEGIATESELKAFCEANGLKYSNSSSKYNNDKAKGYLISYDHEGDKVPEGTTITYSVSLGKPSVDNFVGKDYSALKAQVDKLNENGAGINLKATESESETYDKGKVISQDNSGELAVGSTITVTYSSGKVVVVPDFSSITLTTARSWNGSYNGLTIKIVTQTSDSVEAGALISQSVAKGTKVSVGSEITLTYSEGQEKMGYVYDFRTVSFGNNPTPQQIKERIEELLREEGFTNYKVDFRDDGKTSGEILEQNVKYEQPISTYVEVIIQK